MFGLAERAGTLAIAGALLFAALRVHKSSGRHTKFTKPAGVVLAFVAGMAFLVTFVGSWMAGLAQAAGAFGVAGLIVCVSVIAVDWLLDNKPDKPAFWAAFFLAMFLVVGVSQIPAATNQIGHGGQQVGGQMSKAGK